MTQDPTAGNDARDEQATAPTAEGPVSGDAQATAGAGEQPAPDPAAGDTGDAGTAESADAEVERDIADAERQVAALTDDLQRLHAEYVNYKRRVDRDRELVLQNAKFSVLSALLPVLDDVDRARAHGELEEKHRKLVEAESEMRLLATTDPLTGLDNRRRFFAQALSELTRRKQELERQRAVVDRVAEEEFAAAGVRVENPFKMAV